MTHFSKTILPVVYKGQDEVSYPILIFVDDNLWMLGSDFSYTDITDVTYTAPAGMLTDLASIPLPLWNILPPFGRYLGAAIIHDFLYQTQPVTKEKADHILAEAMDCAGVTHHIRQLIYDGVKFGGRSAWNKHTEELKRKE